MNPRDIFLPTLKSNIKQNTVFYNNTDFIANTQAFYQDLDRKLEANELILRDICNNSTQKASRRDNNQNK